MIRSLSARALVIPLVFAAATTLVARAAAPPDDHRALRRTISYAEMEELLAGVNGKGPVTVTVEGKTTQGRSVYLVHAGHGRPGSMRVLFYAQQHGDEVSGKDALLYLVREIARDPKALPEDVDLWVMPMMNPDGAEAGTRRNGAKADLNRDHIVLEQPETQALHRVARRVRPHVAVDCHEFTRDSDERRGKGWIAWPDITMDGLDNPLFDPALVTIGQRWVDESAEVEKAAGHAFLRYSVGGLPPFEEQRHSAPDIDGGLNAVGMYGGLSFIIEAAVKRSVPDPSADLGARVDAYLVLFRRFLSGGSHRAADLAAVEAARRRPLPAFIPTNYLWVNPDFTITEFPVIDAASGRTVRVPTANMMTTMAVKSARPAPAGYAIAPEAAADVRVVLERHGIPFEEVRAARAVRAETCTLVRLETEFDDLYARYEGRQVVTCAAATTRELPAGSLWVPLSGEAALRTALVLEPAALYGVFQYPRFARFAKPGAVLPIYRITDHGGEAAGATGPDARSGPGAAEGAVR